jgi:hypothetical protein
MTIKQYKMIRRLVCVVNIVFIETVGIVVMDTTEETIVHHSS